MEDLDGQYNAILFQENDLREKQFHLDVKIKQLEREFSNVTSAIYKVGAFLFGKTTRSSDAVREEMVQCRTAYDDINNKIKKIRTQNEGIRHIFENAFLERKSIYKILKPLFDYWPTYPPDWKERCNKILKQKSYCEARGEHFGALHVHHAKPLSLGGSNKANNLKVFCERHHLGEHRVQNFEDEGEADDKEKDTISDKRVFNRKVLIINQAIKHKGKVFIHYQNKYGERTERTIEPFNVYRVYHRIYVEAYCHLRSENRTFRVSRILSIGKP